MLLTLVIILVLIWSAVVGSLYSNFLVFYQNFTETENYHKARYAAIAATERAELVIRQREPWFIWSWWRKLGELSFTWNSPSDKLISSFSYLSNTNDTQNKSSLFWDINSRTDRIPAPWEGNVEKLLAADDSTGYNMMDYENAEVFLLYYDESKADSNPYDKKNCPEDCIQSNISSIEGNIRLPQYVRQQFGDLDTDDPLIPRWYWDDALVDRQLRGNFQYSDDQNVPFTILATQSAAWSRPTEKDSAIREWNLNNASWVILKFEDSWDPRVGASHYPTPTIISQFNDTISDTYDFWDIFSTPMFSELQLRLSLLNLVLWGWTTAKRYPFLEYYLDFGNTISNKYFTIKSEWNYWDYKIDNIIFKPTITESILKSFTTIL